MKPRSQRNGSDIPSGKPKSTKVRGSVVTKMEEGFPDMDQTINQALVNEGAHFKVWIGWRGVSLPPDVCFKLIYYSHQILGSWSATTSPHIQW
jgi:hypothetical protein